MERSTTASHHTQGGWSVNAKEPTHVETTRFPEWCYFARPATPSGPADSRQAGHSQQPTRLPRVCGFSFLADSVAPFIVSPAPAGRFILPIPRAGGKARHEGSVNEVGSR